MIPEQFFDFGGFERYEKCTLPWPCCERGIGWMGLMVGRRELLEIRREDLDNKSVINRIENRSNLVFVSLVELLQKQSDLRAINMARKRSKNPTTASQSLDSEAPSFTQASLGIPLHERKLITGQPRQSEIDKKQPEVPLTSISLPKISETKTTTLVSTTGINTTAVATVKSTRRIVSDASIADPQQDSGGGARVFATNEKASDLFANNLIHHVISSIWPDGVVLDWVQGRDGNSTLVWSSKYFPSAAPTVPLSHNSLLRLFPHLQSYRIQF
jgi:hypothetical protein